MFLLSSILLTSLIILFYLISKRKYSKLSEIEKFILYCEQENKSYYYIVETVDKETIFNTMSDYKPKLFAKYLNLYSDEDIERKQNYIKKLNNKQLKILFKYSNNLTLQNLFNMFDVDKQNFMLKWLRKNRFEEYLPLAEFNEKITL